VIQQMATELCYLLLPASQELLIALDGHTQGLYLTLEIDDLIIEVLPLVAHILEIIFGLPQQLILIFFLLLELLELSLRAIFVLSDQGMLVLHVFDHALQLFDLGLVLFGVVEQLFLVLLKHLLISLQLINQGLLGLDVSLISLMHLLHFSIFVSSNLLDGFVMHVIKLQKLIVQALNLSLLLLVYLSVSHELQVAIYLTELSLVTRLPPLAD